MAQVLAFMVLLAGAWYLLIMRPQRNQHENHVSLVGALRVGDHVMTIGGIFGRVESMHGDSILLEVAPGITARVVSEGIARIVDAPDPRTLAHQQASSMQHLGVPTPAAPQPQTYQQPAPVHQLPMQQPAAIHQQPLVQQTHGHHTFAAQVQSIQPPAQVGYGYQVQSPFAAAAPQPQTMSYQQPPQQAIQYPPVQQAPRPGLMPSQPMPQQQVYQPAHNQQPVYQQQPPIAPPQQPEHAKRSQAPSGMGQSAHIDDSTRQLIDRARAERMEMAGEFNRELAPMVNHEEAMLASYPPPQQVVQPPQQLAGPSLFVNGQPVNANTHGVFPPPLQLPQAQAPQSRPAHTIPMPQIQQQPPMQNTAAVFDNAAFQRPAPFSGRQQERAPEGAAV